MAPSLLLGALWALASLAAAQAAAADREIVLRNSRGMEAGIVPTGACITRLLLPAADGGPAVDVMMGFDDEEPYRVRSGERSRLAGRGRGGAAHAPLPARPPATARGTPAPIEYPQPRARCTSRPRCRTVPACRAASWGAWGAASAPPTSPWTVRRVAGSPACLGGAACPRGRGCMPAAAAVASTRLCSASTRLLPLPILRTPGVTYPLAAGKGGYVMHGGGAPFSRREWEVVATEPQSVVLALDSPGGPWARLQHDPARHAGDCMDCSLLQCTCLTCHALLVALDSRRSGLPWQPLCPRQLYSHRGKRTGHWCGWRVVQQLGGAVTPAAQRRRAHLGSERAGATQANAGMPRLPLCTPARLPQTFAPCPTRRRPSTSLAIPTSTWRGWQTAMPPSWITC